MKTYSKLPNLWTRLWGTPTSVKWVWINLTFRAWIEQWTSKSIWEQCNLTNLIKQPQNLCKWISSKTNKTKQPSFSKAIHSKIFNSYFLFRINQNSTRVLSNLRNRLSIKLLSSKFSKKKMLFRNNIIL